jgi:hypothetical protein
VIGHHHISRKFIAGLGDLAVTLLGILYQIGPERVVRLASGGGPDLGDFGADIRNLVDGTGFFVSQIWPEEVFS